MSEITANTASRPIDQSATKGEIYNIQIRQLHYGYIVEVGCKTFAIEDAENLTELISRYLKEPRATEEQYLQGTLFKKPTA